jgi:protein translocase SecG subunit
MQQVIIAIHLMVVSALVVLVLYQKSEGGALGMGGQSGLFTGRGQANALTRATGVLATIFFLTSIALTVLPAWERRAQGGQDWTKAVDSKIELKEIPAKPDAGGAAPAEAPAADGKESIFEQLQRAQQKRQSAPEAPAAAPPAAPAPVAEPEKPALRPTTQEPAAAAPPAKSETKTEPEAKAPEAAPAAKDAPAPETPANRGDDQKAPAPAAPTIWTAPTR